MDTSEVLVEMAQNGDQLVTHLSPTTLLVVLAIFIYKKFLFKKKRDSE